MSRYRTLQAGEILEHGDEYKDPFNDHWYPTKCAGMAVGIEFVTKGAEYRRPVKSSITPEQAAFALREAGE